MPNRRLILILLCPVAVALLVGLLALLSLPREPSYGGKGLSQWVQGFGRSSAESRQQAEHALRQIGTNAIPYLIDWGCYDPPQIQWLQRLLLRFDIVLSAHTAAQQRVPLAWEALRALGPAASNWVPQFTALANSTQLTPNSIPTEAIFTLGCVGKDGFPPLLAVMTNQDRYRRIVAMNAMRYQGTNALPAIPQLISHLNGPDPEAAVASARTLGHLALAPDLVVPGLASSLRSTNHVLRRHSAVALGHFGAAARIATPALITALADSSRLVRHPATNALLKIAPELLTNAPPR